MAHRLVIQGYAESYIGLCECGDWAYGTSTREPIVGEGFVAMQDAPFQSKRAQIIHAFNEHVKLRTH